ncbi:MAG: saccharopine dehydrogenase NADP-binding domain-containing protein [Deltaproteobacteria bacterium]|nr:saccharopine dehydrogenase NADP-binding domain-containing protein [Deltaproteobacteria bacterium]
MKIALTGASGIQGMSAMIYLLEQEDVEEVQASDAYGLDRLKKRVAKLNDNRLKMIELDCSDQNAAREAFSGYDVVVNCAFTPGGYLETTRAAFEVGAHYLDLTSMGQQPLQHELHGEFEKRGLTAILSMGTAPGLSNIMAVYCMNQLDQTDNIDYYWGIADVVPPEDHTRPLYWGFGFDGIMSLIARPSLVFEDGELKELEPRARPVVYPFKAPVGELVVSGLPHPEPRMLSESFPDAGFKHIMFREGFDDDSAKKYHFLRDLGFNSNRTDPINVKGAEVMPFDVLLALLDQLPPEEKKPAQIISEGNCVVQGWKEGKQKEIKIMIRTAPDSEMHDRYTRRGAFGSYRTGICGAMAGVLLGRGMIEKKGVYEPEICVPAEPYIQEQVKVGMEIEVTSKITL